MFHHCFIDILAACFFEKMHESYHRVFLSVNRRFFCPLDISQPTLFWRTWFSLFAEETHYFCGREPCDRGVSKNVPKSVVLQKI